MCIMEKKHIYWFAGVTTVVVLIVVMLGIAYNRGVFYSFLERNSITSNSVQITTVMNQFWKGMYDGNYQETTATLSNQCIKTDGAMLQVALSFSGSMPHPQIKNVAVSITGQSAQANVYFNDGTEQTSTLVKENGNWKISVPNVSSN